MLIQGRQIDFFVVHLRSILQLTGSYIENPITILKAVAVDGDTASLARDLVLVRFFLDWPSLPPCILGLTTLGTMCLIFS